MKRVTFITSTDSNMGSHRYRIKQPVLFLQSERDIFADIKKWPEGNENVAISLSTLISSITVTPSM